MQGMTFNLRLKLGQLKGILRIRDIYVFKENSYQFFSDINTVFPTFLTGQRDHTVTVHERDRDKR